ncbi:MAG: MATE family efflux transporter [Fusobacterium gastrosuis]|uniref:MATE family efflux transporter n=2 Tax=Fusobacterium TaxID=848 RepID=UPI002A9B5254|nr:MATE family efflux transporter [Fusobacterium gastrosuis]
MRALKFDTTVDLINDGILKSILIFSLPILISNIFQQLYNMADIAIVGNTLGDRSLAAIGASTAVFDLLVNFAVGVGNGLSMVVARNYGAKNEKLLKKSVAASVVIGLFLSISLVILSRFILIPLLNFLNTPQEILGEAYSYISIITLFIVVTFGYNLLSGLLRAIGNSFMSLVFLVIASIINIILDIYFITSLNMGIAGAAIATVIAQAVSVILCAIYIYKKVPILIPRKKDFKFDERLYKELLGQGFSMGFMIAIVLVGTVILQMAINNFGYLIIAAHIAARKLMMFSIMPITTLAVALATFVSQNKGANKGLRIKKGVLYVNILGIVFGIFLFVIMLLYSKDMVRFLSGSNSEEVLSNGSNYLKVAAPFFGILAIVLNTRYALQALGQKILPLVSSVIELIGKVLFVMFMIPKLGYFGVMICEPLIWIIMAIQLTHSFYKNEYIKKLNTKLK